ncbi:MAG: glycosyltransferase [Solirubrobacteraceae bacterium]|nr:glycosyltransferase [Solirubrobacteraceae bacterium]
MARVLLGAFGDPGHVFPCMALGRELRRRGHDVAIHTAEKWRTHGEAEGFRFFAAPEYGLELTNGVPLKPYQAVATATGQASEVVAAFRPDLVVADILTLAPALAGELAGLPVATLVPHVYPDPLDGWPPYSLGARLPRTAIGRALWRRLTGPMLNKGLDLGMRECNETRALVGLPPRPWVHNGQSDELVMVATMPQLEYPRTWPEHVHVVGPLIWEPPTEDVELPPGDAPLVLVAPSTAQDEEHRLLRAAVAGLADLPVRVLATWNRRNVTAQIDVPDNARVVEWVSYARTMPQCDVVVCHAGHGTVARALASGCRVVAVPAGGDMNENAARVDWAGVGVRLPRRATTPRAIGLAVGRALAKPEIGDHVAAAQAWVAEQDGASRAADVLLAHLERRTNGATALTMEAGSARR